MAQYDDRVAAWATMRDAIRAQNAIIAAVMATVSANSITAQNITDINAAVVASNAALAAANLPLVRRE